MSFDISQCTDPLEDRQEAIRNLGGMVWLYEKHLCKFKINYADSADEIRRYLLSGNSEDARRLAHSIKGLSGTLGLRRLYYCSMQLENAIKESAPEIFDYLDAYESCLKNIISENKD